MSTKDGTEHVELLCATIAGGDRNVKVADVLDRAAERLAEKLVGQPEAEVEARLVIELDGGQHADATEYDAARTRIIESTGYRVLRFWNHDVLQQADSVLEVIWKACSERS